MMQRFSLPALEYHVAHGCNLSCQQCSHYSNFHLAGRLPTLADAESEYSQWSHRLKPTRFALLGGEPLLNPAILEHIQLARQHWYDSELMLVTNGFFLHRFPELPQVSLIQSANLKSASMVHIKTTSNVPRRESDSVELA
jgi:molybdenum cofactor biosynthesis enzyme MoaA